jgi:hypothetical protein
MESFARRGIRTTVAVAGLAALGVGLAAPAFAVPGVPDVSGVGSTQSGADHLGSPAGLAKAPSALGALPDAFVFQPPAVDQSAPADAAPSASDEQASDDQAQSDSTESDATESESTGSAPTESTDSTEADSTEAAPSDSAPADPAPAVTSPGLLPTIPGSPVAAQTAPQVSGLPL